MILVMALKYLNKIYKEQKDWAVQVVFMVKLVYQVGKIEENRVEN